jgi:type II secretory pathway pseudopilin PulG
MRRTESGFSIVDFLIIVALLLIVIGMFGPRLAQSRKKANNTAVVTAPAQTPVRPAR